jgi:hypothetical protein
MVHDKAAIHAAKESELRPENAEAKRDRLALPFPTKMGDKINAIAFPPVVRQRALS